MKPPEQTETPMPLLASVSIKIRSWEEIARPKYPDQKSWSVRRAVLRHEIHDRSTRRGRPSDIKLRFTDARRIRRLQKSKLTWKDVAVLLYPDQNPQKVRLAFLRATADKAISEEEFAAKTEEEVK